MCVSRSHSPIFIEKSLAEIAYFQLWYLSVMKSKLDDIIMAYIEMKDSSRNMRQISLGGHTHLNNLLYCRTKSELCCQTQHIHPTRNEVKSLVAYVARPPAATTKYYSAYYNSLRTTRIDVSKYDMYSVR